MTSVCQHGQHGKHFAASQVASTGKASRSIFSAALGPYSMRISKLHGWLLRRVAGGHIGPDNNSSLALLLQALNGTAYESETLVEHVLPPLDVGGTKKFFEPVFRTYGHSSRRRSPVVSLVLSAKAGDNTNWAIGPKLRNGKHVLGSQLL